MAVGDVWAIDAIALTAQELRQGVVAPSFAHDADPIACRAGFVSGLAVSAIAGLNVTVPAFSAVVTPSVGSNGSYLVNAPTATVVAVGARDATYPRWDIIAVRVWDNSQDASGQNKADLIVIPGVPAAAPAEPAVPAGYLPYARIIVPTGATALTAVDKRVYTSSSGGTIPCVSTARPAGAHLRPGQTIYETDTKAMYVWSGTGWNNMNVDDTGWIDCTVNSGFSAISASEKPQVRRIGALVFMRGGFASAGMAVSATHTVGKVPAGFMPLNQNVVAAVGASGGASLAAGFVLYNNGTGTAGDIQIRTSATLSGGYYKFDSWNWVL